MSIKKSVKKKKRKVVKLDNKDIALIVSSDEQKILNIQNKIIKTGQLISKKAFYTIPFFCFAIFGIVISKNLNLTSKALIVSAIVITILSILIYIPFIKSHRNSQNTWKPQQLDLLLSGLALIFSCLTIINWSIVFQYKLICILILFFYTIFVLIFIYIFQTPYLIVNRFLILIGNSCLTTTFILMIYGSLRWLLHDYFYFTSFLSIFFTYLIISIDIILYRRKISTMQIMIISTLPPKNLVSSITQFLNLKNKKQLGEEIANEILKNKGVQTSISVLRKLDYELNQKKNDTLFGILIKIGIPIVTFISGIVINYFWAAAEPIIQQESTKKLEKAIEQIKSKFDDNKSNSDTTFKKNNFNK
jgi:hypothetical protein